MVRRPFGLDFGFFEWIEFFDRLDWIGFFSLARKYGLLLRLSSVGSTDWIRFRIFRLNFSIDWISLPPTVVARKYGLLVRLSVGSTDWIRFRIFRLYSIFLSIGIFSQARKYGMLLRLPVIYYIQILTGSLNLQKGPQQNGHTPISFIHRLHTYVYISPMFLSIHSF